MAQMLPRDNQLATQALAIKGIAAVSYFARGIRCILMRARARDRGDVLRRRHFAQQDQPTILL
jgi:hypothetical protein